MSKKLLFLSLGLGFGLGIPTIGTIGSIWIEGAIAATPDFSQSSNREIQARLDQELRAFLTALGTSVDLLAEQPPTKPTNQFQVKADRQEFNTKTNTFVASGKVEVIYQNTQLQADQVELNLVTRQVTATGNIDLKRGDQKLRGSKLSFNYGKNQGELDQASGAINLDTLTRSDVNTSDRAPSFLRLTLGRDADEGPGIRRLGFRADQLQINGANWTATNLRLTNDPFSPPELEVVTARASLTPISPTQDRIEAESPRLVFDQSFSLPIPFSNLVIDRFQSAFPARVGFDGKDRGGLFYQQNFDLVRTPDLRFEISPQIFLQRGVERSGNIFDSSLFGVAARLDSSLPDRQYFGARASLSSLNLNQIDQQLRFNATYSRPVLENHNLEAQFTFRDRIFNGSLGLQDVRSSIGVNVFSPRTLIGNSGISLNYQFGAQVIAADRDDNPLKQVSIGNLARGQTAVSLGKDFSLWRGTPLPAEQESGLKYSPQAIVPSLDAIVRLNGAYSLYSNGDSQLNLAGTVGLVAELGGFSQALFDYTKLNVSFTQGATVGQSPFLFDRVIDTQIVTAGLVQQVYGPLRMGLQQSWSLSSGRLVDSTYSLEYNRRTYALVVRYSPTREVGELVFRINDFNWDAPPSEIKNLEGGVERQD
ncbi:MAG: DUF3769 domain-containing protein [Pseudanabaenaceae cyanobacterium bins.68]|nr:DUF3769 domain-containing protein [Pseudanabaenaceae cyanobacterium bins.68]